MCACIEILKQTETLFVWFPVRWATTRPPCRRGRPAPPTRGTTCRRASSTCRWSTPRCQTRQPSRWVQQLSAFRRVSACFSVFQRVSAYFSLFQLVSAYFSLFQCISACFSLFQLISACFITDSVSSWVDLRKMFCWSSQLISACFSLFQLVSSLIQCLRE